MQRKILGLFIIMTATVCIGCKTSTTDTPATEAAASTSDKAITLLDISGVVVPVTGTAPVTTITETAQYKGTITWSGAPATFAASTPYTATIVLTAKAGWTLTGVAANTFKVAGATATNMLSSGIVTAIFPATGVASGTVTANDYVSANIGTLKYVPAGSFQRNVLAADISRITTDFHISACKITRAQFLVIMGTDPSFAAYSSGISDPVQMTNWYHAIAFCNKLSIAEGLMPVYEVFGVNFATLAYADIPTSANVSWDAVKATWTNNGYRLPTEMEWMWAAMGATGGTTGYHKAFAGSTGINTIGEYAWYSGNVSNSKSRPVGSKLPNELGLYDMSGNISEWTWDWYGTYPAGTVTDYRGADSGTIRILRCGSWYDLASGCTVAIRNGNYPDYQNYGFGFRVVRP